MSRQLSAKDKAFLAEKQKLLNRIRELEANLVTQKDFARAIIDEQAEEIKRLKTVIAGFEAHSHLSASEMAAHVEREQKGTQALDKLLSLPNALYGGMF